MDKISYREARPDDADGMALVLKALVAAGKRRKDCDAAFVVSHYINHHDQIRCTLAVNDQDRILGFQSLKRAVKDNPYEVEIGWGVIGTHIAPLAARQGIGRNLFKATLRAAQAHGLPAIDATIGTSNSEGLAYYQAMGFVDYRTLEGAVSKFFKVPARPDS